MSTESKHEQNVEESQRLDLPEEIPGFHEFGHIPFEKLHNTRDLGGMPAADGRTIKPARLIRSGCLHKANSQDLARLVSDYHLAGVIDFRTQMERDKEPDPRELMEGVVFYDFPALTGEAIGITHGAGLAKDLQTFSSYSADPHDLVLEMYGQLLLSDEGREAYRSFLNVLLEGDGDAYLWHCTEGKDRAGLAAVIVERALGVPEKYVRDDYLATNLFARNRAEGIIDALSDKLHILKGLDADIDSLFYAYNDYYDCAMAAVNANYGSFDAYLAEALDFGPEKRQALRAKYLR